MENLRDASRCQDRKDVVGLLDCSWFGLEGSLQSYQHPSSSGPAAMKCTSSQAAAGEDLQQDSRSPSRQQRTTPAPAGVSASGWDESARNSPADQGAAMGAKGSSSSPNTPLSDRLLSHSEASGSSVCPPAKQPSPAQGRQDPVQVLSQERKAKEMRGTSAGSSSGSLSDASLTLCLPGLHDSPPVHGGVPSTNFLAAARSGAATPAFRSPLRTHSEEVYPSGGATVMLEPPHHLRRPSALTSAFASASSQPLPESRGSRPMSLLSMQLRNSSRETSQTKSACDSNGRSAARGLPPRVPGRPAFWLSASAGAHPPLLASADDERPPSRAAAPARWLPRDPPAAAARPARRPMAASAPGPGRAAFAAQLLAGSPADDDSSASLVRSLSDTTPSSMPCSPAPPRQCTRRSHHQEHRAVHRWLESLPGRAATSSSPETGGPFATVSRLIDRPRARGGAASEPGVTVEIDVGVEDGYCHVVCAGCSPLGRHARQPPATRPRLLHLLRARTCPEPLPQVGSPGKANQASGSSAAALGSWAERIFVHQPHEGVRKS